MDGFKKRLNESVQLRLSFSLSLAILVVAAAAGIFSFLSAFHEAYELQDDMLRQVAVLFDRQQLPTAHPGYRGRDKDKFEDSRVIVQSLASRDMEIPLPATLADGFHTLNVNRKTFRVLVKTTTGGVRIAVAQETDIRNETARDGALRTVMPFLILVPILLVLVAHLVRKLFRPIASLSMEVDQRDEQELHPVPQNDLPSEVRPFAMAINRLLARVAKSMDDQRRFVADAAHELRSPLTAMSLQAERLAEAEMSGLARERLTTLQKGIERGRNLMNQLLTLAKAQATVERPKSSISVQSVYRHVLEDLMPLADAKHIDIGVEGEQDASVMASEPDLTTLVKNLVDNAIRYTPDGGKVDLAVSVLGNVATLQIKDSGPGIPASEHGRVFDPFYRALGSDQIGAGLGLSIVKTISERIGAKVRLSFSDESTQSGLCVSVAIATHPPLWPSETSG